MQVYADAITDVQILGNTLAYNDIGIYLAPYPGGVALPISRIANNIVVFNRYFGIRYPESDATTPSNGFNLVHGNGDSFNSPGAGTLTTNPLFRSHSDLRLQATSPAISTGNYADAPNGSLFDADGELRRIATIDMGAFEYNSVKRGIQTVTANNIAGTVTYLQPGLATDTASDRVFITPLGGALPSPKFGAFFGTFGGWAVFNQGAEQMIPGWRFAVSVAGFSSTNYAHGAGATSINANASETNHPELNNRSFAIATVTPNYNPPGQPGRLFNEQLELDYFGSRWWIAIPDVTHPMRVDRVFNIRIAPLLSPIAFVATLNNEVATRVPGSALPLRHRLLDGRPCAAPLATKTTEPFNVSNNVPFALEYRDGNGQREGHWYIVPDTSTITSFPALASFNVIVDGQSGNACADEVLIDDGFE